MRWPRVRIPPLREWTLFGRPIGECLYLGAMAFLGANALQQASSRAASTEIEWTVLAGQLAIGSTALGVILATLLGRVIGLRLLWLFGVAVCFTPPLAAWGLAGAPSYDVFLASLGGLLLGIAAVWYGRRRLHAAITRRLWPRLLALHDAAASDFVQTVGDVSPSRWSQRPSSEAWSPAEITEHLARTYSQYAGEARGKNALRIRLRLPQRALARAFVKPRLLAGAPFPKARAPRALLPVSGPATPADGAALFRATGAGCLRDLGLLAERRPHRELVHPYLGALPLYEVVQFAVQHIRHHHRQLQAALAEAPSPEPADDQSP
ncbi:MAG: DinB family protein [Gemmatimonadetes bacterium]|nr:DinB family protein [Gemmatimonadota bacterium]